MNQLEIQCLLDVEYAQKDQTGYFKLMLLTEPNSLIN